MLNDLVGAVGNRMTTSSDENIFTRLINSVVGVLIGIVLFILSFAILWWNEGNVIAEKGALEEMRKAYVKVSAEAPSEKQNNKLVYASATLKSAEKLGDGPHLKPGAYLALERNVEMYQWIETAETTSRTKLGGGRHTETTYSYSLGWARGRIDSAAFKMPAGHDNPPAKIEATKRQVTKSTFGKYDGGGVLTQLHPAESLPVDAASMMTTAVGGVKPTLDKGLIYYKKYPLAAQSVLGDTRVSYKVVRQGPVSVMAKQLPGFKLGIYRAKNGKEKILVESGVRAPEQMITQEKAAASSMAMVFRIIGFFCMWIGLNLMAGPITTLLDVIPFLGSAGRLVLGAIFFVVALVLSLVTIGISMIAHHPVVLALFLAAAVGGAFYYQKVVKPRKLAAGAHTGGGHAPKRRGNEGTVPKVA